MHVGYVKSPVVLLIIVFVSLKVFGTVSLNSFKKINSVITIVSFA